MMPPRLDWYAEADTPDPGRGLWWAIEHNGHPAWYQRALMPGDFAPGRCPLPRHVESLDGVQAVSAPVCGTCGQVAPAADELEPIERATGRSGFLADFRLGRRLWPAPTNPASCWLCCSKRVAATVVVAVSPAVSAAVCPACAAYIERS